MQESKYFYNGIPLSKYCLDNNIIYEEFESEIKYYLLMVINRTNLNVYGQIIKYMDLTVKGYFRSYQFI